MVGILLVEAAVPLAVLLRHAELVGIDDLVHGGQLFLLLFGLLGGSLGTPLTLLVLLLGHALHLHGEQLPGGARGILAAALASPASGLEGGALQGGSAAIKDEDGLHAMPQQLADAAEEADDVAVAQGVALLVTDGFEELVNPDGGVDSEALSVEGGEVRGAGAGLRDGPESLDTHGGLRDWKTKGRPRWKMEVSSRGLRAGHQGRASSFIGESFTNSVRNGRPRFKNHAKRR